MPSPAGLAFSAALGGSPCYDAFQHEWAKWVKLCILGVDLLAFEAHQNSFASCNGSGNFGSYMIYLVAALLLGALLWRGRNLQASHGHRNSAVLGSVRCVCRVQVDFYG